MVQTRLGVTSQHSRRIAPYRAPSLIDRAEAVRAPHLAGDWVVAFALQAVGLQLAPGPELLPVLAGTSVHLMADQAENRVPPRPR